MRARKKILTLALALSGCSSQGRNGAAFSPPPFAPNHQALIQAIPAELYRGDFEDKSEAGERKELLDFIFLKNQKEDTVPMRVAVYVKDENRLALDSVVPTPFSSGDCGREECRARISMMPEGFQISRENLTPPHFRADYRFAREGKDLKLVGRGFQVRGREGSGRSGLCMLYFDYKKNVRLSRIYGRSHSEPLPEGPVLLLMRDQLKFEQVPPEKLCSTAAP